MSADWPVVPLATLVTVKGGKRLPKEDSLQAVPTPHPYIRVRDMGQRFIPENGLEYVPINVFPKIKKYIVEENDVIISIVGTIGLISLIDNRFHLASQTENSAKLTGLDRIDSLYLYYFLTSDLGQNHIKQATVGAVQAKLPLYNIEKIPVVWPERSEREIVVKQLGTMDDKIELNRQINQTLEQIAQVIFKSWFIDFEPVKAKIDAIAEGRDPERAAMCAISGKTDAELVKLPLERHQQLSATAALFPDGFEESELGLIPKGWVVGTLADLCILNARSWGVKSMPHLIHYVDLANTKNGEISDVQVFSAEEAPSRARRVLRPGDTMIGTVRPGNRSFALIGSTGPTLTGSTGFAVLSPKSNELREIVFMLATGDSNIDRLTRLADGAAYPAVRPEVVMDEQCILPPSGLVERFHLMVRPLFNQILANRETCENLVALRDTLLPKLLSGEIQIINAS